MRKKDTHAFSTQLLVCLIVSFGFGGSIGLGAVWMRLQIAVTAKTNATIKASIDEVKRRHDSIATMVESEQGYEILTRRNAEWRLGLAPATDAQVVRVTEDPVMRLARRRDSNLFSDGFVPVTFRVARGN